MPNDPDQPGGSHDPTRANDPIDPTVPHDPVDPTVAQDPVDTTRVQGAAPAAGMGRDERFDPLEEPPPRRPEDDRDRKGAWWLWALLAAILIAIVLFALLGGDDDDGDDVGTTDQTTDTVAPDTSAEDADSEDTTTETSAPDDTEDTTTDDTTATSAPAAGGDAPAPDAGEDPGTVTTTDGTELFTLVQGDAGDAERLSPHVDQDLTGEGVYVLEVVDGEGFWIGASDQQRIFAHASDDVAVEAGQRIGFDGFLKANPAEDSADVHDIPEDQGAELHRQQGHHIELRSLTPA